MFFSLSHFLSVLGGVRQLPKRAANSHAAEPLLFDKPVTVGVWGLGSFPPGQKAADSSCGQPRPRQVTESLPSSPSHCPPLAPLPWETMALNVCPSP